MISKRVSANIRRLVFGVFAVSAASVAQAGLNVVTTLSDLRALVQEIAGTDTKVEAFCKGSQDPHFLEAKPSFMVAASRADLVIATGLGLEVGWLPNIVNGSRNPKIMVGQPGYLEVGPLIDVLEIPSGAVSRAEGDVHPEGNPHVLLDPLRAGKIAVAIAERLAALDPAQAAVYKNHAEQLRARLETKTKTWEQRIAKTGITKVITYHKTLNYFLERFHMQAVANLEPLPGVAPTAKHILDVIAIVRSQKVPLIMVENYFDAAIAERVRQEVKDLRIVSVPVSVDGAPGINTSDDLFEKLVSAVEGGTQS